MKDTGKILGWAAITIATGALLTVGYWAANKYVINRKKDNSWT